MNTYIVRAFITLTIASLVTFACADPGRVEPAISGKPSVTVTATDMHFSAAEIRLPSDGVNLTFRNEGAIDHDLTIQQLGVHLVARPKTSITTGLASLRSGRYEAICTVQGHRDAGMRMTVVVE